MFKVLQLKIPCQMTGTWGLGDNNKYFHKTVKMRNAINRLDVFHSLDGIKLTDTEKTQIKIVNYFKSLYSDNSNNPSSMKDIKTVFKYTISDSDKIELQTPATHDSQY